MGPIHQYFSSDHRRLERLLDRATESPGEIEPELYRQFRAGLLRHIGLEERLLIPTAEKARGSRLPMAAKIRLDHGALAALMVPPPSPGIISAVRDILLNHNQIEEETEGLYALCDNAVGARARDLAVEAENAPEVRTMPYNMKPETLESTRRALARAGYNLDDYLGRM